MGRVTIYMSCLICSRILHYAIPGSALSQEVCYMFFLCWSYYNTVPELYLIVCWYVLSWYTGISIVMFVYIIQSNYWLYFILVFFSYVFPMSGLSHHCIIVTYVFVLICLWMLYLCLLQYVFIIHPIWSLGVIHLGNLLMNISCI